MYLYQICRKCCSRVRNHPFLHKGINWMGFEVVPTKEDHHHHRNKSGNIYA